MSGKETVEKIRLRFLLNALAAWFVTALALLLLFSFIVSRIATSSQSMAYFSSALSFFAAAAAGAIGARSQKINRLLSGLLCGGALVLLLLLTGFIVERKSMSSDAVLSLASFSIAGALAGSVFFGGEKKRSGKTRVSPSRKGPRHKS